MFDTKGWIRLAEGEDERLRSGHLWVYANEIAEVGGDFADGDLVWIKDEAGHKLGTGLANRTSRIVARLLTRGGTAPFSADIFRERLAAAVARRKHLAADARRLVNAEGDLLPGLIVDQYRDVAVVQTQVAGWETRRDFVVEAVGQALSPRAIVLKNDSVSRKVEGLEAYLCETAHEARIMAERGGMIPLLIDPQADTVPAFSPIALVDARMTGDATGTTIDDAPLVVGIGPGFRCGRDAHLVVESCEGPRLGRVLAEGEAGPDPEVEGVEAAVAAPTCVLAPAAGAVVHAKRIGDLVEPNEVLCRVEGTEARSRIGGRVSGLIHEGIRVERGWRVAAIDPLGAEARPEEIGFRPLAIAGGVLEAMLSYLSVKVRI